ncbi:MAG: hypothetical protein JO013_15145 [Alphaproteobacteria bacterium]|nr:hypothetical protein [Alphaproteobacteria bacterium]
MGDSITADEPSGTVRDAATGDVNADFREFILTRELSEVFLLLDNLAADSDTTISALSKAKPPEGLAPDWIQQICQIKWPPTAPQTTQADQAALVIKAKDYLNGLAKPASGSTIAFTLLFTQRIAEDGQPQPRAEDIDRLTARRTMAAEAYPEYVAEARRFQGFRRWLWTWLCVILAFTCFLSWYVAYGNAALGEYATLKAQFEKAQTRVDADELGHAAKAEPGPDAGTTALPATAAPVPAAAAEPPPAPAAPPRAAASTARGGPAASSRSGGAASQSEIAFCERFHTVPATRSAPEQQVYETAEQRQACRDLKEAKTALKNGENRLYHWLGIWRWILGVTQEEDDAWAVASRLTGTLGSTVLPIFYGLLGAGAAVLRNLSRKITLSTLSPRDLNLSILQLGLGAVTGACIGLFIVAPGKDAPLIGPVTLSGSAISFIAGFGVEAVFQALETLIGRVFNISGVAPSRADARRGPAREV